MKENRKKYIVIINGTGGSGKDTFVELVSKYAKVKNFSTIDKVKQIATICGWEGGKEERDRKFLSDLKFLLTDYNDLPFQDTMAHVEEFKTSNEEIMFIHVREPENIQRIQEATGAITLLIQRTGLKNIESNVSDKNVDNYSYDFVIHNDTLEGLEYDAKSFVHAVDEFITLKRKK